VVERKKLWDEGESVAGEGGASGGRSSEYADCSCEDLARLAGIDVRGQCTPEEHSRITELLERQKRLAEMMRFNTAGSDEG